MKYVNVNEIAAKWNLSERSVRRRKTGQKETSGKNSKRSFDQIKNGKGSRDTGRNIS